MKVARTTRRMFLVGAGGAALTVPFLPSLFKRSTANAQTAPRLKYILVSSNYCADLPQALPFDPDHKPFGAVTQLDDATKRQSLDEIVQKRGFITSSIQGDAWDRLRPYMNVIMGSAINGSNDKHNSCSTAASIPEDVDHNGLPANDNPLFKFSADYLAERLLASPAYAFSALRINPTFRHGSNHGYLQTEYQNYAFGGPRTDNPRFATVLPTMRDVAELEQKLLSSGASADDPAVSRRKRTIDAVLQDYRDVMASPRLSRADRDRFQGAIDLWNDAQRRMQRGSVCAPPMKLPVSGDQRANWRVYHEYTMDLCTYGLACGVAPVVNYALRHGADEGPDLEDGWYQMHGDAHTGSFGGLMGSTFSWRLERMAYFGNRLLEHKDEMGAPLLDSTMLLWSHEYTFPGAHPNAGHWDMMLGKAGGRLSTGNYLDVMGEATVKDFYGWYKDCVPYNRLLLTTLLAIGHTNQTIEAITGSVGFGEYGDVAGGTNDHRKGASFGWSNENRARFYTDAEKRKPLPILKSA